MVYRKFCVASSILASLLLFADVISWMESQIVCSSSFLSGTVNVYKVQTNFLMWLCGHTNLSIFLWHHQVCVREGKVPLALSHWEYLFISTCQLSIFLFKEGLRDGKAPFVVLCFAAMPPQLCGVAKKCCFSWYDGEIQQQKILGLMETQDSQEVVCEVSGVDCL